MRRKPRASCSATASNSRTRTRRGAEGPRHPGALRVRYLAGAAAAETVNAIFTFAHSISTEAVVGLFDTMEKVMVSTAFPAWGVTSNRSRSSLGLYLNAPHCFATLFTMNVHLSLFGIAKRAYVPAGTSLPSTFTAPENVIVVASFAPSLQT